MVKEGKYGLNMPDDHLLENKQNPFRKLEKKHPIPISQEKPCLPYTEPKR